MHSGCITELVADPGCITELVADPGCNRELVADPGCIRKLLAHSGNSHPRCTSPRRQRKGPSVMHSGCISGLVEWRISAACGRDDAADVHRSVIGAALARNVNQR